jgi:hypothetical protein
MIDPFHREGAGEHVPVPKIVGGDHAALNYTFSREGNAQRRLSRLAEGRRA